MSFLWGKKKEDKPAASDDSAVLTTPSTAFGLESPNAAFDDEREVNNSLPSFMAGSGSSSAADLYASAPRFSSDSSADGGTENTMPALSGPLFDTSSTYGMLSGGQSRGNSLDYLFSEDFDEIRKKSWGEQLVYLSGITWLGGGAIGSIWGTSEGLKSSVGKPRRLRINAVLNAVGKRGFFLGNSLGVLALMFSGFESILYHYVRDDAAGNYIAAGAGAGMLFKSTHGWRVAGRWGAGIACLSTGLVYGSRQGYYGRGLQGVL